MSVIPLDTFGRNMEIAAVFSNMTVISIINHLSFKKFIRNSKTLAKL